MSETSGMAASLGRVPGRRLGRVPGRRQGWPSNGGEFREGAAYVRRGQAIARLDRAAYLRTVAVYALPSLLAGYLAAAEERRTLLHDAAALGLPWLTIVLGATVLMAVVGYHGRGRRIGLGRATLAGLRWVPRYVWTNCHTTVIFWAPVGLLLTLRGWQESHRPAAGAVWAAWWVVIVAVALYLHCRTLLAPFLAVHADLPGTEAVVEAWRLSGRHFGLCLGTFVFGTLPVALPLLVGTGAVALAIKPATLGLLERGAPDLAWAGVHAIRPLLVPAVYCLYKDLWHAELARRGREGAPATPAAVGWLLALTRPLPRLGRWG
jgi:hypothetical protein